MEKFTKELSVRYSDVGPGAYAEIAQIMAWFQDVATDHSEHVGYSSKAMYEMGAAWIVLHWDIRMHSRAYYNQKLYISTWASGFSSAYGHRMFTLENEAGELVAEGESVWVLYDFKNNKFLRVSDEMTHAYGCEIKMPSDVLRKWKFVVPQTAEKTFSWQIRRSDTDTNQHTNNVSYVRFLCDCLENGGDVRHIRVTYKKSLYLHETAELLINASSAALMRDGEVSTLFEFEY